MSWSRIQKEEIFWRIGMLCIAASLALFVFIFYPILVQEVRYLIVDQSAVQDIVFDEAGSQAGEEEGGVLMVPENGIVIPKIGAVAPVVQNVDPFDEEEYRRSLMRGVAHAEGSAFPGEKGVAFYFAHSSDTFYASSRYNTVFYLLYKLERGDVFYIGHGDKIYEYSVEEERVVSPEEVEYLQARSDKSMAILMTCWPSGTTAKRLLVIGRLQAVHEGTSIEL